MSFANTDGYRRDDHILPFLWLLGGDRDKIERQMRRIHECGIGAVCLESRTFEDFGKDAWWETVERILLLARELGMKVWILDDKHFPTGYANGMIEAKYPERRRMQIAIKHIDVIGPGERVILANPFTPEDRLLGIYAYRRTERGSALSGEAVTLGTDATGRYIRFDAPEGCWRVFTVWMTHAGAAGAARMSYINMLDPRSVDVMIEAVYDAHYEHLGEYFGRELVGFFSDEPSLGNDVIGKGISKTAYDNRPGLPGYALPWREGLEEMISEKLGADFLPKAPLLWYEGEGFEKVRDAYMDTVSAEYGRVFTKRLGDWCRAHGVEYIGHVIEDMNSHARLGNSTGHFFRGLEGQDMAGMDIVLHQVMPGFGGHDNAAILLGSDVSSGFFHYSLARLAASLAHIRPHMKDRAMCEVFGAYGWAEDSSMMKWLMDHLLVHGINYFVPHAFSMEYPNPDCPPHFDANGENPQFEDFAHLMKYTSRMTGLVEGGRVTKVAVLYHAEAEWSGRARMLEDEPAVALGDGLIDFDIIPSDDIFEPCVKDGMLKCGNAEYGVIVVPWAECLPGRVIKALNSLKAKGVCIIEVNALTAGLDAEVVPLESLAREIRARGFADILPVRGEAPFLRVMHTRRCGEDVFMLFNEATDRRAECSVRLPVSGSYRLLDLMGDSDRRAYTADGVVDVDIGPYESRVMIFDGKVLPADAEEETTEEQVEAVWRIETADASDMEAYTVLCEEGTLCPVDDMLPDFAGRIRYSADITLDKAEAYIVLDGVGDSACLRVNGEDAGRRICPPFMFDISKCAHAGVNRIEITVSTTLVRRHRDSMSEYVAFARPGVSGGMRLVYKK